jgi:hypothetical protein
MKIKNTKIVYATIIAFISFLSISYFSCLQKTGLALACDGVACQNGGYCLKGQCMCPTGYEDSTCSTSVVDKYIGTWNVRQIIITSDSAKQNGHDSLYQIAIVNAGTNTSFFINNFLNNNEYNHIVCSISPTNSYNFTIDTTTNAKMRFDHINFWGGTGTIYLAYSSTNVRNPANDSIIAGFVYKFLNPVVNWQVDTIKWVLTNHQPLP